jgi:pseudouridine-5'-phosphate glycosidase
VEDATAAALTHAAALGIRGAAVTPFLLTEVQRRTDGASVRANLALLAANAGLAGAIAVALQGSRAHTGAAEEDGTGRGIR